MRYLHLLAGVVFCCLATQVSSAEVITLSVSDNATVQPGGPRAGSSGKNFLNIEGDSYGNFASFGVIDFTFSMPSAPYEAISSMELHLTQSNAAFSVEGPLSFWLSTANTVDINAGTSSLIFDAAAAPGGVGAQLDTLYALGTGTYSVISTGFVDIFNLSLGSTEASDYLLSLMNSGGTARFVVAADDSATAATYAGAFNSNELIRPALVMNATAVPEPATLVVLTFSGLAGLGIRYRNQKRGENSPMPLAS